ncbi:MAG: hypothetical protein JO015_07275 [Verrucomicrobia bacterium]|nr:hypothetical protein [Verrucomicrobiota bacterium]
MSFIKSKRAWVIAAAAGWLACVCWSGALQSTHRAHGDAPQDPLIGDWAGVERFGPLEAAQVDVRLKFSSDHSLSVEMAAGHGPGTSPEDNLAGRGTWQRRANQQVLLTVEHLRYGINELGSGMRAKRVKRWCNKVVNLIDVGDRRLVLTNLFRPGEEVFMRSQD